jgi:surface protein
VRTAHLGKARRRLLDAMVLPLVSLLLPLLLPAVRAGHVFEDRVALLAGRDAWCADAALAEATYGHISTWNVSGVADMSYLFCAASGSYSASNGCNSACSTFNGNVSAWDVSSVTCMEYMFYLASSFNQPLWRTGTSPRA